MEACRALLLFLFCLREAEAMPSVFHHEGQGTELELSFNHHEGQGTELELSFDHHEDSELKMLQTRFDQLQASHNNLTTEKDQLQTSFDQLQASHNNLTTWLCESYGMTFDGDAGVCYYISNETKSWDQSRQACIDMQSDLIMIKSKEKQTFFESVARSLNVWIGLTDSETEGVMKWVDGTPVTTPTFWYPDEEYDENDCVYFSSSKKRWNDMPCTDSYNWMCERAV